MLESGKVENEKRTTKTATTEDGKKITEEVVVNKDTGEVKSHKVDGKEVEKETETKNIAKQLQFTPGNFEVSMIHMMNAIFKQMLEINYYVRKLAEKNADLDDKELKEKLDGRSGQPKQE